MKSLGKAVNSARGFPYIEFKDRYGAPCCLQASSLAEYEKPGTSAVWLGVVDTKPQIMASQAKAHGVVTDKTCGWVPYPIPKEVLLSSQMHLDREQVEALIHRLTNWLEKDKF